MRSREVRPRGRVRTTPTQLELLEPRPDRCLIALATSGRGRIPVGGIGIHEDMTYQNQCFLLGFPTPNIPIERLSENDTMSNSQHIPYR